MEARHELGRIGDIVGKLGYCLESYEGPVPRLGNPAAPLEFAGAGHLQLGA